MMSIIEDIFDQLKATPASVTVSADDAAEIWTQFRPGPPLATSIFDTNFKYRAFMQAAMMSWIEGSSDMGYIHALWAGSVKPTATVKSILKKLLKEGIKQYYKKSIKGEPELYVSVRDDIAGHTNFQMISQGLDID